MVSTIDPWQKLVHNSHIAHPVRICHTAQFLVELSHDYMCTWGDKSANTEDGARLHIVTENFWGRDRQSAFFDIQVFNPFAWSHCNTPLAQCYWKQELEKKRVYIQRANQESGVWHILTPSVHKCRRNGTNYNSCIQEARLSYCWEARQDLREDSTPHQM